MIRLLVGLGNPTPRYEETRHNAGFLFVQRLADREGLRFVDDRAFQGEVADWRTETGTVRLLKPSTYMNRSGDAVRALAGFHRIQPEEVLVVHDDLDLPPGAVRLKMGGGHGGHNGLRDILAHLGTGDFLRLRLGIGRPAAREDVVHFVLTRFASDERCGFEDAVTRGLAEIGAVVRGDVAGAMNRLNARS